MAERTIGNLDSLTTPAVATATAGGGKLEAHETPQLVDINYPDPVLLSLVVRDVARWSGHCFVMEPSVNTKLQIFAPHKLGKRDAYELFLASLSVVNLRAVQVGNIVKLVPITLVVAA